MKWSRILDLDSQPVFVGDDGIVPLATLDGFSGPVRLITDFQGSAFGVESVTATRQTAKALLEKKLRERGDLDASSVLLVHRIEPAGSQCRVFYTAVAHEVYERYAQLAQARDDHFSVFPWAEAFACWTRAQDIQNGTVVWLAGQHADVVALVGGTVVAAERIRSFGHGEGVWRRIAHRIAAIVSEAGADVQDRAAGVQRAVWLVESPAADPASKGLVAQGLTGCTVVDWQPAATAHQPGRAAWHISRSLFDHLRIAQTSNTALQKLALLATRVAPAFGVAAFAASAAMALLAFSYQYQLAGTGATLTEHGNASQALAQQLDRAVKDAERMSSAQRPLAAWFDQLSVARNTPELQQLVAKIRAAQPSNATVLEIGMVVEKKQHLITATAVAGSAEAAIEAENRFAENLKAAGFDIVKRDVLTAEGQNRFRLSMQWSKS
jgi:hypothetical protein